MFTIGQFSRITGLTLKTIRLYHERGLLIPKWIDQETGYRYFDSHNVERARAILYLRDMPFPLTEVKELLNNFDDQMKIVDFLEQQKSAIEVKKRQFDRIAHSLDSIIKHEREAGLMLERGAFEITEKGVKEQRIAGLRWKGRYSETGKAFQQLGRLAGRYACGAPFNLYYDGEYKEEEVDIESCFPVKNMKPADGIIIRQIEGGKCVSLVHRGPYEELGRSYAKIYEYIQDKRYTTLPPIREIYVKGPGIILKGNPRNYLTEIQILVDLHPEKEGHR